jgi:hypothetical protein
MTIPNFSQVYIDGAAAEQDLVQARDIELAKRMADLLHDKYPGHPWMVWVDSVQGVAVVRHVGQELYEKLGFVLHLNKLDPGLKRVVMAGGELLERMNVMRGKFRPEDFTTARAAQK